MHSPSSTDTIVSPREAWLLFEEHAALLVDVREPSEFSGCHVPDAIHVPLSELPFQADELIATGERLLLICRSGARSGRATQALAGSGYVAANITGGMLAWCKEGLPVEPVGSSVR